MLSLPNVVLGLTKILTVDPSVDYLQQSVHNFFCYFLKFQLWLAATILSSQLW